MVERKKVPTLSFSWYSKRVALRYTGRGSIFLPTFALFLFILRSSGKYYLSRTYVSFDFCPFDKSEFFRKLRMNYFSFFIFPSQWPVYRFIIWDVHFKILCLFWLDGTGFEMPEYIMILYPVSPVFRQRPDYFKLYFEHKVL